MPPITVDQISKIIESCFKTQHLDKPVIDHVLMLVNRHVEACKLYGVAPEITRTVIEAVEDSSVTSLWFIAEDPLEVCRLSAWDKS